MWIWSEAGIGAVIGGIVEHIEAAGTHSGDSMGVFPPQRLKPEVCERIEQLSLALAGELKILGFLKFTASCPGR